MHRYGASMGAFCWLLEKGKRLCLPNSRVMIHQPLGGVSGQATDIEIHAKEILALKNQLNKILSQQTGQSLKTIAKDTDRDNFMSAQDALKYGIVDNVIEKESSFRYTRYMTNKDNALINYLLFLLREKSARS